MSFSMSSLAVLLLFTNLSSQRFETFWEGLHELSNIFEKLKFCMSFSMLSIAALLLLTNLIRGVTFFERACMSLQIFLKSWSFVWAFQYRPLQFSNLIKGVTLFERACMSSEIIFEKLKPCTSFSRSSLAARCDTFWKVLHKLRIIFEKLKLCMSFSMSSLAALPLLMNLIRGVTLSCQQTQRHKQKMHTGSERYRALTETYQINPIESGASRCCLDRFLLVLL